MQAGSIFEVECFLRHRGEDALSLTSLEIVSASAAMAHGVERRPLHVEGHGRSDFRLALHAPAAGRCVLHGVLVRLRGPLGLFEMPLYFPNRLRITVVPRRASGRRSSATPLEPPTRTRKAVQRKRGSGTDLHELRELRPGDPYRTIAWKTSARLGRLVVKEVEQEENGSHRVVVDVSPSMRHGAPGQRKIDRALEVATAEVQASLARGDRVGVTLVDERVLAHLSPDNRPQQGRRAIETLLAGLHVVDDDRTELDDLEVAKRIADYVRHQDGIDFQDPLLGVDADALAGHVAKVAMRGADRIRGRNATARILRRYAQIQGIPLPYRAAGGERAKTAGLAETLRGIERRRRAPSRITLVTDFDGVRLEGELRDAVAALRAHGHVIDVVLVQESALAVDDAADPLARVLRMRRDRDAQRLRATSGALRRLGVHTTIVPEPHPHGMEASA